MEVTPAQAAVEAWRADRVLSIASRGCPTRRHLRRTRWVFVHVVDEQGNAAVDRRPSAARAAVVLGSRAGDLSADDVRAAGRHTGHVQNFDAGLFSARRRRACAAAPSRAPIEQARSSVRPASNAVFISFGDGWHGAERDAERGGARVAMVRRRRTPVVPQSGARCDVVARAGSAGGGCWAADLELRAGSELLARFESSPGTRRVARVPLPGGRWARPPMVDLDLTCSRRSCRRPPRASPARTRASWACAFSTFMSEFARRQSGPRSRRHQAGPCACPSSSCSTTFAASTTPARSSAPPTVAPWRSWCCAASRRAPIRAPASGVPSRRRRSERKSRCRGSTCRTPPRPCRRPPRPDTRWRRSRTRAQRDRSLPTGCRRGRSASSSATRPTAWRRRSSEESRRTSGFPMLGEKRSLNVASAAAVVLYELLRRRRM